MNGRGFRARLARLETKMVPRGTPRILYRYTGSGSERYKQPTQEELEEGWPVLTMRFVPAKDGRPATPSQIAGMYPNASPTIRTAGATSLARER